MEKIKPLVFVAIAFMAITQWVDSETSLKNVGNSQTSKTSLSDSQMIEVSELGSGVYVVQVSGDIKSEK